MVYYYEYFGAKGYLPSPFIYDKADTFMDFFHVLYWSTDAGRYSVWGSVYPPLSFLIMKLIGFVFLGEGTFVDGFDIRAQSYALRIFIVILTISMVVLAMSSRVWKNYSIAEKSLFFVFYCLSAPVLFAVERGNIITVCLPLLAGVLASTGARRLVFIAILINLKPYFALLALAPLVAGRWQDFLFIIMCSGAIFVISGLTLDPDFLYFLPNIISFGQSDTIFSGREVLALPTSIEAFAYALTAAMREGTSVGQSGIDLGALSITINQINTAALILAIVALFSARNRLPQTQLFAFQIVLICNLGVWVGGYSFIFYPLLIPALFAFRLRWIFVALILLILLPLDLVVLWTDTLSGRAVFSTGLVQSIEYQLGLGTVMRPVLDFALLVLLSVEILVRSWLQAASGGNQEGQLPV